LTDLKKEVNFSISHAYLTYVYFDLIKKKKVNFSISQFHLTYSHFDLIKKRS